MSFGYKYLLSYQLSKIAFDLGWEFIPQYFIGSEFSRQRDQIYQDLRSHKQNIVEGSAERSLSSKLKLYDVSKSSGQEALEDFAQANLGLDLPDIRFRVITTGVDDDGYAGTHFGTLTGATKLAQKRFDESRGIIDGTARSIVLPELPSPK